MVLSSAERSKRYRDKLKNNPTKLLGWKTKNKIRCKKYNLTHKEQIFKQRKQYRENNKIKVSESNKQWRLKNKQYISRKFKEFRIKNKDELNKYNRKYYKEHYAEIKKKREPYFATYRLKEESRIKARKRKCKYDKTEKGKINMAKTKNKRKRNLGFKLIIPNILDEKVAYHHIDDEHVIPIPKDLHDLYNCGMNKESHRENLKPIIEQLYETKFD